MARLRTGEKDQIRKRVYKVVQGHYHGVRQEEIAQSLKMDSRRINNYLRELQEANRIYKEGRLWFAE